MTKLNCSNCDKEYKGYGKICGTCRSKQSRAKSVATEPVASVAEESVALKKVEITGKCHGCGEQQPSTSVCICHLCIAKGTTHNSLGLQMCEA